jgi:hypothetical protein
MEPTSAYLSGLPSLGSSAACQALRRVAKPVVHSQGGEESLCTYITVAMDFW